MALADVATLPAGPGCPFSLIGRPSGRLPDTGRWPSSRAPQRRVAGHARTTHGHSADDRASPRRPPSPSLQTCMRALIRRPHRFHQPLHRLVARVQRNLQGIRACDARTGRALNPNWKPLRVQRPRLRGQGPFSQGLDGAAQQAHAGGSPSSPRMATPRCPRAADSWRSPSGGCHWCLRRSPSTAHHGSNARLRIRSNSHIPRAPAAL